MYIYIRIQRFVYFLNKFLKYQQKKMQISSWTYLFKNIFFILSLDRLQTSYIYIYIYIYIYMSNLCSLRLL